jgi:ankyrin repeat protein
VAVTRALLAAGAAVDRADNDGFTALYAAVEKGQVEAIRVLLAAGAEVDHACNDCTALHAAAQDGYVEAIRVLVEAGANINRADSAGQTPLAAARAYDHAAAAQALVQAGATE